MDPQRLESYPATPVQHGMLLRNQADPCGGAYIQQLVCAFPEGVNGTALRTAWRDLVARHAVLRTAFRIEDTDGLQQIVFSDVAGDWNEHDWRACNGDGERRLEAFLLEDRRKGFALDRPPLWRVNLFRLADRDYRWVWTSQHALLDGRSRLLLMRELFALYEAHSCGTKLAPEPSRAYGDFARWLAARSDDRSRTYWQALLAGFPRATALPERDRPAILSATEPSHGTATLPLSEELSIALRNRAEELGVTPNTILQGAWALLLGCCAGTDDVVFGATRACRSSVEGAASMVGLFINTLPVRVRLDPSAALADWLRQLRAQWIVLREHEHTSPANVQRWSEVPPGQPLFESIAVFENFRLEDALRNHGSVWNGSVRLFGTTNYPLIVAGYGGTRILIELTWDRRRFDDKTIIRLRDRLQAILEGIVANPSRTLAEVPILPPDERRRLSVEWNDTAAPLPRESIARLFERQAAQTPDAIALTCGDRRLTYRELNIQANRLAHHLRRLGVGLETPVPLCVERSPELVIALLGILKVGGAYVPLDAEYPQERIERILRDVRASVLLTQERLAVDLPPCGAKVVCLDRLPDASEPADDSDPECPASPATLAYIMYTSGSTGTPKGAAIPHAAVVRLVIGADYVTFDSTCVIPQIASVAFDALTFEVWGALLNGGRVVLVPGRLYDLATLAQTLREHGANTLFLTTALFNAVIDEDPEMLSGVRQLLFGGEVPSVDHVRRALQRLPRTKITQVYGPTETTTFATFHPLSGEIPPDCARIPIGKPIRNTQVFLLDAWRRLAPIGVPGEIHIGGPGLARGYWNAPEATTSRFISNPWGENPDARLYRTGDLARYRPDGNLEFLGRLDEQVKLRGFRIEPGEIEAALRQHPRVRQAVVVACDAPQGTGRRLIAYVAAGRNDAPSAAELRSFLEGIVPEYMIPAAFVVLDELPLSSNGKVDRGRLPVPDAAPRDRGSVAAVPRTPIEAELVAIFAELLRREDVGIHDDFFELGGHSLLAMQAVARARKVLGIEVPLSRLFETATVAGLARSIAECSGRSIGEEPVARVPEPRGDTFPLLASQISIWDIYRANPGKTVPNTCRAYRLRGRLDAGALRSALEALAERHEALRTIYREVNGRPVQVVRAAGPRELPLVDLSRLAEGKRLPAAQAHFDREARYDFDLANDATLRTGLLRLGAEDHVLLLVFNHIALDGWSLDLFNRELSALYEALSIGNPPVLPEVSLQPGDVALWEQWHFQSETGQRQIAYWKKRLEGAQPQWGMPAAGPPPGDFRSLQHKLLVPGAAIDALRDVGRQEGCTLSMTMFAAFNVLLHESTGQEDLLVVTPLAGRTRPEIDGLFGCYRKLAILRSDLSGQPTFRELLRRTRDVATGAYAHLDVSQEIVFPEWGMDHPLHRMSLPVQFNFLERPEQPFTLPGLAVSSLERTEHFHWMSLNLVLMKREHDLALNLKTRAGQYPDSFGREFLEEFRTLLERLAATPEKRLTPAALIPT